MVCRRCHRGAVAHDSHETPHQTPPKSRRQVLGGKVNRVKGISDEVDANAASTEKRSPVPMAGHSGECDTQREVSRVSDTIELAVKIVGSPAALARALAIAPLSCQPLAEGNGECQCDIVAAAVAHHWPSAVARPRDDGHVVLADLMAPLADAHQDKRFAAQRAIADDLGCLPADFDSLRKLIASLARAARREKRLGPGPPRGDGPP